LIYDGATCATSRCCCGSSRDLERVRIDVNRFLLHEDVDARIKSAHDEVNETVMAVLVTAIHVLFSY